MTAISVCTDMTEGIINRFRTMAISRVSVLTGQVLATLINTSVSAVLVVAAALAFGFRPSATPLEWLGAAGLFVVLTVALTWVGVSCGLFAKTPAGANTLSLLLVVLPFVSNAFVPTASIPAGVRWFAEYQPFTSVIETLRGLLIGTGIGWGGVWAVCWCVGIAVAGYLCSGILYERGPAREAAAGA
jgi:ABC-2 type transport system permease protein